MKDYLCLLRTSLLPLISFSLFCVRSSSDNPIIPLLYSPVSFLFLFFFCFWFGFFPPFLLYSLLLHVLLFVGYSWKSARICIPNLLFLLFPSRTPLYFLVQFLSFFFFYFFLSHLNPSCFPCFLPPKTRKNKQKSFPIYRLILFFSSFLFKFDTHRTPLHPVFSTSV